MAFTATPPSSLERERTLQEELAYPIVLTQRLIEAESSRSECEELARRAEKLSLMLRKAVRLTSSSSPPSVYDRPIRRVTADVAKTLEKALTLVRKCKHTGILRHVFLTITSSAADFKKVSNLLESSIADLNWLLSIFDYDEDGVNLAIPPIASNDPILAWVWSSIASLQSNRHLKDRVDSANRLASLARDNERYRKVIAEEGALPALLRLLKDGGGSTEGQIAAAMALFNLMDDMERTRAVAAELGFGIIAQVFGNSSLEVQITVADLVAKIAEVDSGAREEFGKENVLKTLISCLMMDLNMEDYKRNYSGGKASIRSIVHKELAIAKNPHHRHYLDVYNNISNHNSNGSYNNGSSNRGGSNNSDSYHKVNSSSSFSYTNTGRKERLNAPPEAKHKLKVKCALALWRLCEGSLLNSQKVAEPKGFFCLSKLIESQKDELRYYCLMTVMEVAKVAENNADLRKVAWKPSSPAAKAVLDQVLRVIKEESDSEFRVPAIKAVGCLARIFPAKETGVVCSLVAQLGNVNVSIATKAAIALAKFASPDNHNCGAHSKTIIDCNGVPLLMKLLGWDDPAKTSGLVLLCYLSIHVGNSRALADARALRTLENAVQSGIAQRPDVKELLKSAIHHLMLYQEGDHPHSHIFPIV